jgi:glycosyltransferase involved in cell wall biosynthesis
MNIATPSKVLEYAVMGLPIVASRLQVLEDLFGTKAIQFHEPGSADQFARCVLNLYERPALRRELVANCDATFVSTHSWDREQRVYLDLVNRLLGFPALSNWKTTVKEVK